MLPRLKKISTLKSLKMYFRNKTITHQFFSSYGGPLKAAPELLAPLVNCILYL